MRFFIKIYIIIVLVILLFLEASFFLLFGAPNNFIEGTIVNIEQGFSLRKISQVLKDSNIIRSRVVFEIFVITYDGEKHILPGDYLFEKNLPVFEIAKRISIGKRNLAPIKITIPEGFNINEIIELSLLKIPNFDEENFLLLAKNKEGYLFPDTYFLFNTDNEEDLFQLMVSNYETKVIPFLPATYPGGLDSKEIEKEIITMASIIEKEALGEIDREYISGILWNRLKIGMPLQVDVAPITYKIKGLPSSPISNPGLEAIKAAIYPKNSPYLFYLHGNDGLIHYAKTFDEHRQNKLKYLK